jgi:Ribosomal protein S5, C-terminal domain
MKVSGKVASVFVKLVPAPRGTGIVAAPASKRMLQFAGIQDVYTQSRGSTSTVGNFIKATFAALSETYGFLVCPFYRVPIIFTSLTSRSPRFSLLTFGHTFLCPRHPTTSTLVIFSLLQQVGSFRWGQLRWKSCQMSACPLLEPVAAISACKEKQKRGEFTTCLELQSLCRHGIWWAWLLSDCAC